MKRDFDYIPNKYIIADVHKIRQGKLSKSSELSKKILAEYRYRQKMGLIRKSAGHTRIRTMGFRFG